MPSRSEQIDRLAERLKSWSAEMDRLEERARQAKADVRADIEASMTELKAQKELLTFEVDRLRAASDAAWGDVLDGVSAMAKALEDAFNRARSRF